MAQVLLNLAVGTKGQTIGTADLVDDDSVPDLPELLSEVMPFLAGLLADGTIALRKRCDYNTYAFSVVFYQNNLTAMLAILKYLRRLTSCSLSSVSMQKVQSEGEGKFHHGEPRWQLTMAGFDNPMLRACLEVCGAATRQIIRLSCRLAVSPA